MRWPVPGSIRAIRSLVLRRRRTRVRVSSIARSGSTCARRVELLVAGDAALDVSDGANRRGTRPGVDQAHLAEHVARPESAERLGLAALPDADLHRPRDDDIGRIAGLALGDDPVPGRKSDGLHRQSPRALAEHMRFRKGPYTCSATTPDKGKPRGEAFCTTDRHFGWPSAIPSRLCRHCTSPRLFGRLTSHTNSAGGKAEVGHGRRWRTTAAVGLRDRGSARGGACRSRIGQRRCGGRLHPGALQGPPGVVRHRHRHRGWADLRRRRHRPAVQHPVGLEALHVRQRARSCSGRSGC